jgi:hypothetical protein
MGLYFGRNCLTSPTNSAPDPSNYTIREIKYYKHCTFIRVHYPNCSNFEGEKIVVVEGYFKPIGDFDPHFSKDNDIIARFRPDLINTAKFFCRTYKCQ